MSAPARAYKTRAIVLRGRNYGEADRILTLFTTERGKLDAIAKGVRRPRSHFAGRLEFGNEVDLGLHRGKSLEVVVNAEIAQAHWQHLVAPEAFAAAAVIVETVDALCEPDLALPDVYALLAGALGAIGQSAQPLGLVPRFSLRLLDALGLAPPLERCIRCDRALDAGAWLDVEQGGFACAACGASWNRAERLDADDLRNLQALGRPRGSGATVSARPAVARAVEGLVAHHLGRKLRAGVHAVEFVTE